MSYLVGLGVYVVSAFMQAGQVLDPLLTSLGMTPESYLLFGRQYHGKIKGRKVAIYFVPSRAVWPKQLSIYVEAKLGTSMALGHLRPMRGCQNCIRLDIIETKQNGLQVYAQERKQAELLLTDTVSRNALIRLLDEHRQTGFRELYLQPEQMWFLAHPQRMTEGQFRQWLETVLVLAAAGERTLTLSE